MERARRAEYAARFERAIADPRGAQRALLCEIVRANADTEFGRAHRFAEVRDLASFAARVPPAAWDDFAPAIDRMLRGEPDVLIAGRPVFFARTSGTSGRPKHVGYPASVEEELQASIFPLLESIERDHPGASEHAFFVSGKHLEGETADGTKVGSASGFARNLGCFAGERYFRAVPEPILEATDFEGRYYALLRVLLALPLRSLGAHNPSTLLTLFAKVAEHGDALADDLARGTLAAGPPGARALAPLIASALTPAPAAADRLRGSLRAHGKFVPREVWPDLAVLNTWKGGASVHYLAALAARCPGCAIRPAMTASTEGQLMVPLADGWVGGVPALASTVLEFLPAEAAPSDGPLLEPLALDEARGYRLVVTNRRGLYRLVMDDVFFVEGFHRGLPILRFAHRAGVTSSLTGEKLTEGDIIAGAEHAIRASRVPLAEFQAAPEWDEPPRYLFLVELEGAADDHALAALLAGFERGLAASNLEYASKRASGRLSPPELLVLAAGSFERMRRAASADVGRSDAQTKVLRLRRDFVDRRALAIDRALTLA